MLYEIIYMDKKEEYLRAFNPWINDFKVVGEMLGGYHEKSRVGRYLLEVNIFDDGLQLNAYRQSSWNIQPLKFHISSLNGETVLHIGKLDGEGANLLNRLVKAFNL